MEAILAALADPGRWRLVNLLAERPRPVGVLAELAGARQPQTTKHLQALERAGLVASQRNGQRRIYALRSGPLRDLATALHGLAEAADGHEGFDRYAASAEAERLAATGEGWADGRSFRFTRTLPAAPAAVWPHLTEPALLGEWWAPDDFRVTELVFDARPGGRIVLEYRDIDDKGSDLVAGRAEGEVTAAVPGERLAYRLSPLLPDGSGPAFTSHVEFGLRPTGAGTDLDVHWRLSDSTVDSADFIAGIEIGFGQTLDKLTDILNP